MAEGQGFEPWVPLDTPVFKTGAFDHSAIPPVYFLVALQTGIAGVHLEANTLVFTSACKILKLLASKSAGIIPWFCC